MERNKILVTKSFLDGYTRVLDLYGSLMKWPDLNNDKKKDYEALEDDWRECGQDFRNAVERYRLSCTR